MPRPAPWFGLAAAVVALDHASKAAVLAALAPGESVRLAPFFDLVLVFNRGAAFSFLAAAPGWQTPLFAAIAVAASLIVGFLIFRNPLKSLFCFGLALILGGALGNLWDRLAYGHVVDFLDFHAGAWHWPAFNAADSAITVGAGILILEGLLRREGAGRERRA
ncbi:MAG TPA: signal peptidase II [Burkholderiales bacterium]|nr:signal peptidase II [Burkholderiales bacterium]